MVCFTGLCANIFLLVTQQRALTLVTSKQEPEGSPGSLGLEYGSASASWEVIELVVTKWWIKTFQCAESTEYVHNTQAQIHKTSGDALFVLVS